MPSRSARFCAAPLAARRRLIVGALLLATLSCLPGLAQQPTTYSGVRPLGQMPTGSEVIAPATHYEGVIATDSPLGPSGYAGDMPVSAVGSGSYFNPTIGSHIRARYTTRSYGQEEGTFDIGSMKLMEVDGGFAFLDGQVTMNDESRVGYNVGIGYRWLTLPLFPNSPDDQKIMGVSLWSDGQSFGAENFVPQVGVSLEFLGDRLDFRANGYTPLGPTVRTRDFGPNGEVGFFQNFIGDQFVGIQDTLLTVGEMELAGRIQNLDAWAFGAVYGFRGGAHEEVGGKIGLRGYATPDLLVSIALTSDDLFDTRAVFNATWFIGRTRAENCPTGVLTDRFREPVLRNQYIASTQERVVGARNAFRDLNNEAIRIVHIDSGSGAGGNGTFENPYGSLAEANQLGGPEMEGDILLVHGGSTYTDDGLTLMDNQRLLGEGLGPNGVAIDHTVATLRNGVVTLPETSDGASMLAAPLVTNGAGFTAVMMADNNEVNNLRFDGGDSAISSGDFPNGAGDPEIRNLIVSNTIGNGIELNSYLRTDTEDADNDGDTTEQSVEFNVVVDEVHFNNVGGNGLVINASDDPDGAGPLGNASDDADVLLNESIDITNVSSTGGAGVGIDISNTHEGSAVNISDYTYDGAATALGGLAFTNVGGLDGLDDLNNLAQVNVSDSSFTGGAAGGVGISIMNSAAQFTFEADNEVNNVGGTTVLVEGDFTGANEVIEGDVNFNADITNADGRSVIVQELSDGTSVVTFNGDITDTGDGIEVTNNSSALINFNGAVGIDSDSGVGTHAVSLTGNAVDGNNAAIGFNGGLTINTTGGGEGFVATGGGSIGVLNGTNDNTIDATGSTALRMDGVAVSASGVTFNEVNADGAVNGVVLNDLTGGQVQIGADGDTSSIALGTGEGGVIRNMTADGVVITNTENVEINGLLVQDPAAGFSGIDINNDVADQSDMTVALNDVGVATSTPGTPALGDGVNVTQGTGANAPDNNFTLNMTNTAISETGNGYVFNNVEGSVSAVDSTALDITGTAIDVVGSGGAIQFTFPGDLDTTTEFSSMGTVVSVDGGTGGSVIVEGDIAKLLSAGIGEHVVSITNSNATAVTISGNVGHDGFATNVFDTNDRLVSIVGNTGGNITFSGELRDGRTAVDDALAATAGGLGIFIQNNSANASIDFTNNVLLNTGGNTAVTLNSNDGSIIDFAMTDDIPATTGEQLVIETNASTGFFANDSGTISVTGSNNTINTVGGVGLLITDTAIRTGLNGDVTFESVSASGAANGIQLTNTTGGTITVGENDATLAADAGGTISGTTGAGVALTDASNVVLNRLRVEDTDGNALSAVHTAGQTEAMNVTVRDSQLAMVNNGAHGVEIDSQGTGAFGFQANGLAIDDISGDGVVITELDGSAGFNDTDIDGTVGDAVRVANTDAGSTVIFDADSSIGTDTVADVDVVDDGIGGRGVGIDGGEGSVTHNGDINNVAGLAVEITGATGGTHVFGGDAGTSLGLRVAGNTDTNALFTGSYDLQSGAATAVEIDGNTDSNVTVTDATILTTTGAGVAITNNTNGAFALNGATSITTAGGDALDINTNDNATTSVNDATLVTTGGGDGVTITGNTGGSTTFTGDTAITTENGTAFEATGDGEVTVTGAQNTIAVTGTGDGVSLDGVDVGVGGMSFDSLAVNTGAALRMNNLNVGAAGVTIDEVQTTGAAATSLDLADVTGGAVTVGQTAGTQSTLSGTIAADNVASLTVNNAAATGSTLDIDHGDANNMSVRFDDVEGATSLDIDHSVAADGNFTFVFEDATLNGPITSAHAGGGNFAMTYNNAVVNGNVTAAHTGAGTYDFNSNSLEVNGSVDVNATDGGAFDFFATNLDIDTSNAAVDGLSIALGGSVTDADISLTGTNTSILTGDGIGFGVTSTGSAKDIRFQLATAAGANTIRNNSASQAFSFVNDGGSTVNATISSNLFANNGAGEAFRLTNEAASTMNLALVGNAVNAGKTLILDNNAATARFTIANTNDTELQNGNPATVVFESGVVPPQDGFTFDDTLNVLPPTN